MMTYANRIGVTIAENSYTGNNATEVEKYLKNSKLLEEHPTLIRMDVMGEDATEDRLIEGIKKLIS